MTLKSNISGILGVTAVAMAMFASTSAMAESDTLRFMVKNRSGFCVTHIAIEDYSEGKQGKTVKKDKKNFCTNDQSGIKYSKILPNQIFPGKNEYYNWGDYTLLYGITGGGGGSGLECRNKGIYVETDDAGRITAYSQNGKTHQLSPKSKPQLVTFTYKITGGIDNPKCSYNGHSRKSN